MKSDQDLIANTIAGETAAFQALVERYQRRIFSFLRGLGVSSSDIDDVAQDTFFKAFKYLPKYDEKKASFSTWIYTIAKNTAFNHFSYQNHRRKKADDVAMHQETLTKADNIEKNLLEKDQNARVRNALKQVPEPFLTALVLSYFKGLSQVDIAKIEACSVGTVKSRIYRGKQALKHVLERSPAMKRGGEE